MNQRVKKIAITGAAGQIAYQLLFRIGAGEVFGKTQPVSLQLLEIPSVLPVLKGVQMELEDCAFPLLQNVVITSNPHQAFEGVEYALLIGAKPRTKDMQRKDLLLENGAIFFEQGRALEAVAHENVKVIVVGNPCNTNCLIALNQAKRISKNNFFAMTRLDQNRAISALAKKLNVSVKDISHLTIWGNHSSTQLPDFFHAKVKNQPLRSLIGENWLKEDFLPFVRERGKEIIEARGASSAGSAAQALIDMIKDIDFPSTREHWFSCGILSNGNSYGIESDLVFSFPCYTNSKGEVCIVDEIPIEKECANYLKISEKELIEEKEIYKSL